MQTSGWLRKDWTAALRSFTTYPLFGMVRFFELSYTLNHARTAAPTAP